MTENEAIQFLDNIKQVELIGYHIEALNMAIKALETIPKYKDAYGKGWDDGAKATYEHLKMCEEEQSGDLISRQRAISLSDELKDDLPDDEYLADMVLAHNEGISEYQTQLSLLPSVNPQEPKWIPVSERLPEHYQNILFSTKTDRVFEGRYFKDETEHQWYSFRDECFAWNNVVTAWMPLPKPYEPQESEVQNGEL